MARDDGKATGDEGTTAGKDGAATVEAGVAAVEDGSVTRTPLDLSEGSYYSWPDRKAVREFQAAGRRVW